MSGNALLLPDRVPTIIYVIFYISICCNMGSRQSGLLSFHSTKEEKNSFGGTYISRDAHISWRNISMNHILAICDVEEEYALKLTNYINLKEGFPFQVRRFSRIENLVNFTQQQVVEAVLVSEEYMNILADKGTVGTVIMLSKEHIDVNREALKVYKYQSGEKIIKAILQILAKDAKDNGHITRTVQMKVIGLYSPVKRCLQTTFGLTLGQILGKKAKVLYINLEGFSGLNVMLQRSFQKDLSELLYYLQNGKQGISYILSSMVDSVNGLDILPPMLCQMDLISIEAKEWLNLFYEIERYSEYEYLILDLSDSVQGLFEILRQCTIIYTMTESDGFAMAKIDQYEQMLKQCQYDDVLRKTNKCEFPRFTYLPRQLDRLTVSELADVVRECLKEDIYAVR